MTPSLVLAQSNWPDKPLRLVVPFPPGGSTDAVGRLLATELSKDLGQNVIVENRGGANGNIGAALVANAPADGYTLLLSGVGSAAINYTLYKKMPYANKDFAPISLLAIGPNVLVAGPSFPAKDFADFIERVRKSPGKYTYASPGAGSSGHLAMEMLSQAAKLKLIHAPYKGGAPAITDTIGGHIDVMFLNQDNLLPYVRDGKLRALAVASNEPNPAYPGVPTLVSLGYPDVVAQSWFGLAAPAGTPLPVLKRLNESTVKALASPAMRERLESVGFVVVGNSPEEFAKFIDDEINRWGGAVKYSGAQVN